MTAATHSEPMAAPASQPVLLSIPEAARRLSLGRSTLYVELSSGRLQSVHVGRRRLIPAAALDSWLANLVGAAS